MIRERREVAAAQGLRQDLDGNKIFQDLEAKASFDSYTTCVCTCVYIYVIPLTRDLVSTSSLEFLA